jgi:rSAM/selenodomain-associated transferase 2
MRGLYYVVNEACDRCGMKISVIIPVLHEEENINPLLGMIRERDGSHDIEIIVSDGDEGGSTISRITDEGVIRIISEKGRAVQMNRGAEAASGDVLLFLHADTVLPRAAFDAISAAVKNEGAMAGAFGLSFDSRSPILRFIAFMAGTRSRITRVPFGDQAIFITKDCFRLLGGYREIPIMEDVEIMKRIRKSGWKIHLSGKRVISSARKWREEGIFFTTLRNWVLQLLYFLGVKPERLVRYYYRHY